MEHAPQIESLFRDSPNVAMWWWARYGIPWWRSALTENKPSPNPSYFQIYGLFYEELALPYDTLPTFESLPTRTVVDSVKLGVDRSLAQLLDYFRKMGMTLPSRGITQAAAVAVNYLPPNGENILSHSPICWAALLLARESNRLRHDPDLLGVLAQDFPLVLRFGELHQGVRDASAHLAWDDLVRVATAYFQISPLSDRPSLSTANVLRWAKNPQVLAPRP